MMIQNKPYIFICDHCKTNECWEVTEKCANYYTGGVEVKWLDKPKERQWRGAYGYTMRRI